MADTNTTAYATPEEVTELEASFVPRTEMYLGCGDERRPTAESVFALAQISPESAPTSEAFVRYFGGVIGMAKAAWVAGNAMYPGHFRPSFYDLADGLIKKTSPEAQASLPADLRVHFLVHSADAVEGNSSKLDVHGPATTGCAYANGVGATAELSANNKAVADAQQDDLKHAFGDDNEGWFAALHQAQADFVSAYGSNFAFDRKAFLRYEQPDGNRPALPVMILAGGAHAPSADTTVAVNFDAHTVSKPDGFYNNDVTVAAELIIRAFPELFGSNPEPLLRALVMEIAPVRAVLAMHDPAVGELNPHALKLAVRGKAEDAIRYLQTVNGPRKKQ